MLIFLVIYLYCENELTLFCSFIMDPNMKLLQEALVEIETDAEQLLLARHQVCLCANFLTLSSSHIPIFMVCSSVMIS
jgi:hypothetical protein